MVVVGRAYELGLGGILGGMRTGHGRRAVAANW